MGSPGGNVDGQSGKSSRTHYGWVIVLTGGLTVFSCLGLARFAYSMLLPSMGKALALGYDQMGFIGTGNFAGYLFAVALSPFLMHWWGGRRTITSGLFVPLLNRSLGSGGWRSGWQILGAISFAIAVAAGLLLRDSPAELGLRPLGETGNPGTDTPALPQKTAGNGIVLHL